MSEMSEILKSHDSKNRKDADLPIKKEEGIGDFMKTAVFAVLLALMIRTFFYEPFNIPSGSMYPTLEVGDYLFVSKPSYGYSRYSFPFGIADFEGRVMESMPKRGDVIVFKLPNNTSVDYIKRLIGMPGDRIQMIHGRLYINGQVVEREEVGLRRVDSAEGGKETVTEYIETLPDGTMFRIFEETDQESLDDTDEFVVPDGHYFMMGDNRDNSMDSRVIGMVPSDNLVGRAEILFFSIDQTAELAKPWTWPGAIRYGRLLNKLGPVRPAEQ
jgi:signal peptidase I